MDCRRLDNRKNVRLQVCRMGGFVSNGSIMNMDR